MSRASPWLWPLLAALAAATLGVGEWWASRDAAETPAPPEGEARSPPGLPCPAEHLLDDGVCVPLPPPEEREPETTARIELLPGRPPEYARYLTPIASASGAPSQTGLGVFVAAARGTPVMAIGLEAQVGPARRATLPGPVPRLLTVHRVERGGSSRSYVLIYAGLDVEPSAQPSEIPVGTPLGRIAAGPAPTGLNIEVRQLRRGVDADALDVQRVLLDDSSSSCDARNVLPLKPAP